MLDLEISTVLEHNAFNPERICWFKKHFDGITASDEASLDYTEADNSKSMKMVEIEERLKSVREVGCHHNLVVMLFFML